MKPEQLNLWTGKHPRQNIIDRLTEKIASANRVPAGSELSGIDESAKDWMWL